MTKPLDLGDEKSVEEFIYRVATKYTEQMVRVLEEDGIEVDAPAKAEIYDTMRVKVILALSLHIDKRQQTGGTE